MIYQRHMPREELFSAQLELLMQNGRLSMVITHGVGILATVMLFWPYVPFTVILLWAAGFIILLLVRSLLMSNALVEHRYRSEPQTVYWQLLLGAALTGSIWSAVYIYAAGQVPLVQQYLFLLFIIALTAFSIGFATIIREYFIVHVFAALWPIAWWSLAHYWQQPNNATIGLVLLGFCALLIQVCHQTYNSFCNMISLNWEREQTAQELGNLTGSLRLRNRQLRDARRQLTDLANVDELTGLGNRRMVNAVLHDEINRARRNGAKLSMIMLDVDGFKDYNDTYGHPAGDLVLQKLADLMRRAAARAGEVAGRWGGEEFVLILPGASAESAMQTAARLSSLVDAEAIPHKASPVSDSVTVSQGVVTVQPEGELAPSTLIKRADDALYRAKRAGRNAIVTDAV
ncbi:MAG: GGDEF domain-containing protein [Pseudomonadota bacterium]